MKKTLLTTTLILSLLMLSVSFVSAAVFAKYDGIDGEATDADHDKWIDVLSIDWGVHKPGGGATGSTRRRGDVVLEDIVLVKEVDKASPKLTEAALTGKVFPKVEIHITASTTNEGRLTYYAYELTNVRVTSYSISGGQEGEDAVPTETLTLNFEKITWGFQETEKDSSIWNFFGKVFEFLKSRRG